MVTSLSPLNSGFRRSPVDRILDRDSTVRRMDWVLNGAVLGLLVMGTFLVWSATRQRLIDSGGDPQSFLKKHLFNVVIGIALGAVTMLLDYRLLRAYAPIVYGISVLGLVAVLSPLGSTINGAHSWIVLPLGFSVQPSEFAKVALVVGVAVLLGERQNGETAPPISDLLLAGAFAAVPIVLIMAQPDLGTTMVIGFMLLGMLAVAGVSGRILGGLLVTALIVVGVAIKVGVLSSYQVSRFAAFANPSLDPRGVGYNTGQARIAIISARFNGFIVSQLEAGAIDTLQRHGVAITDITAAHRRELHHRWGGQHHRPPDAGGL